VPELPTLVTILTWAIALYQAWSIGANDETTAPLVSGRTLTVNKAIITGSVLGLLGAVLLGGSVQEAIGTGFLKKPLTEVCALIILLSSSLWLTFASYFGLSVSTTHSTISSLIGFGILTAGLGDVNWGTISAVIEGWIISMPIGFFATFLGTRGVLWLKTKFLKSQRFEQICAKLLILSTFVLVFSRWGNDVGNASGVMISLINPIFARFISALAMSLGLLVLGPTVVSNLGARLVVLTPSAALVTQMVATPLIFAFTLVGIPLSGTHVMVASMLGGARALNSSIEIKLAKKIGVAWLLSFIVPALIAMMITAIGFALKLQIT
jgi:PiT family inorganic phosphate transporter